MHLIMNQCGTSFMVICYFYPCNSELVSGVVSTALSSGTVKCPTDDFQLDTPVRITIEHSDTVKVVHYDDCSLLSMLLLLWN